MTERFAGKVACVTGAGSGIGEATALRLAREGARIHGVDVAADELERVAAAVAALGSELRPFVADVARRDRCFAAVADAIEHFGRLDVLCNIAGIFRSGRVHEMPGEDWDRVIAVNLSGAFYMCQAAIPHLLAQGGNIVNMASNAGLMGQAYTAAYGASKAALINLTRSLAMEYMKQPLRVNALAPSGTITKLALGVKFPDDPDPDLTARYAGMRGVSRAEEIADAVAYLASDDARSVHGAVWSIDNGVTAG
ncbi:MAG: SDR family oxidoreductase [Myxococcales bacterium]|nr:SDR family oxidoreductase [Myxococcales bacterium]